MTPPRLVIGAPQGRSGKTTVSLGLCAALAGRGLLVQPFKKGPDYIDPSWLSEAAGRTCRTLDPFFLEEGVRVRQAFARGALGADLCLIEGNHGLYDSLEEDGSGSTAAVARALGAPILLVVNASRASRSIAALVQGYQNFEPDTPIAGVVLNNVAGVKRGASRHEEKLRRAVEYHCGVPVVGAMPRDERLTIPDRHLGLIPRGEDDGLLAAVQACRTAVERYLDLDLALDIARSAAPWLDFELISQSLPPPNSRDGGKETVIGVIRDQAFTFYYPANLEALEAAGAGLVVIDALHDPALPSIDGLYIGGGFPEMFMEQLEANYSLRAEIRSAVEGGLPVYAECGGLMYLSRRLHWGLSHRSAEMVGALPCEVEMTDRPQGHGYVIAEAQKDHPFLSEGTPLRGHEFHHSRVVNWDSSLPTGYRLARGNGLGGGVDGLVYRNVVAGYTHLHADGCPGWAEGLVSAARGYAQRINWGERVDADR